MTGAMEPNSTRLVIEAAVVVVALSTVGAASLYAFVQARRGSPGALARMGQTVDYLSERVDELERARRRDHQTIMQMALEIETWKTYALLVADRLRLFTEDVPAPPGNRVMIPPPPDDRTFAAVIASLFNREEMDDLAFQAGVNPDELEGETVTERARFLVRYARRNGLSMELLETARRLRPKGEI